MRSIQTLVLTILFQPCTLLKPASWVLAASIYRRPIAVKDPYMAENNLQEILKPFYQRASEAETRLERLEAAIASERNSGNEELLKKVGKLDSNLEEVKAEQASERQKVQKELQQLNVENAKLQYRIIHLVRALKDADFQLQSRKKDTAFYKQKVYTDEQ